jgi:hypothetical protein
MVVDVGWESARRVGWRSWTRAHPFITFVGLTYAISWPLLALSVMRGGQVPLLVATAGPTVAAALVVVIATRGRLGHSAHTGAVA